MTSIEHRAFIVYTAVIGAARLSAVAYPDARMSVEVVRVRGPDAAHLAEIQLEAIKEVLAWALTQYADDYNDQRGKKEDWAA